VTERRARVEVAGERATMVFDLRADLVAALTRADLSERTLRLMLFLADNDARLRRLATGRIEIDVSRDHLHPYLREALPRVPLGEVAR